MYENYPGNHGSQEGASGIRKLGVLTSALGVAWIVFAGEIGAPPFMLFFGVAFIAISLIGATIVAFGVSNVTKYRSYVADVKEEKIDPAAAPSPKR